jgi:hypothetical protein
LASETVKWLAQNHCSRSAKGFVVSAAVASRERTSAMVASR